MLNFNPLSIEEKWQKNWQDKDMFLFDPNSDKPCFSIDTPPPTISGNLHMGHVYSYVHHDIIARYHREQGKKVFFPIGFDDNGLPTENLIIRELGDKIKNMTREQLNTSATSIIDRYTKKFKAQLLRFGYSADFNLSYSTFSPSSQKIAQQTFLNLHKNNSIYRKKAPSLYCTCCKTAIARSEIEHKEKNSILYDIAFTNENKESLSISTTRPEFLCAAVAAFVNPDDERFKHLVGTNIISPFGKSIPVLKDRLVDPKKGTGIVLCAPYGDETDLAWIREYNLIGSPILNKQGQIHSTPLSENPLDLPEYRKLIVKKLYSLSKITQSKDIKHKVGTHERCGQSIDIIPIEQWFVRILDIKNKLMNMADDIEWHPKEMKNRYLGWLDQLKWDWSISRQRPFGIPIPVSYNSDGSEVFSGENHSNGTTPDTDVLSTWFTSSLTPLIATQHFSKKIFDTIYPFDLRQNGRDIIHIWDLYTLIQSYYRTGKPSWKNLMISGLVKEEKKIGKLSKSKQNAKPLEKYLETYGADVIRLWSANNRAGEDTTLDENKIIQSQKTIRKLLSVGNYITSYLEKELNIGENISNTSLKGMSSLDKWLLIRCKDYEEKIKECYKNYELAKVCKLSEEFLRDDISKFYIETTKKLHEKSKTNIVESLSSLKIAFLSLLKGLKPIIPHVTSELIERINGEYEINLNSLNALKMSTDDSNELKKGIKILQEVLKKIYKFKSENNLGSYAQIHKVVAHMPRAKYISLKNIINDDMDILRVKEFIFQEEENNEIRIDCQK